MNQDFALHSPATDADFLHDLLVRALKAGASDASIRGNCGSSLSVEVADGALQDLVQAETAGISLTTYIGKRRASLGTNKLDRASLDTLVERVVGMTKLAEPDPWCGLADPGAIIGPGDDQYLEMLDPRAASAAELERWALELEQAARSIEHVSATQGSSAEWQSARAVVMATNGLDRTSVGGHFGAGIAVVAGKDGIRQVGHAGRAKRWHADLPALAEIGREAGHNAVAKLGGRKIASCRAPVVIDSEQAMALIGPLFSAIDGKNIARGTSFLGDKLGERLFPKGFKILNDPFVPRGLASRACDAEGLPARKHAFIDDGILTSWILDLASARELGLESGANAGGLTNVTVKPGKRSRAQLMADAGNGLLVTEFMGQSLNPHTGDWSIGVSGQWFENGEIAYPVTEMTIAGNLKDIYTMLEVGSDLEIRGASNCPSLLIPELAISGA